MVTTSLALSWSLPPCWHSFSSAQIADGAWRAGLPPSAPGTDYAAQLDDFASWVAAQPAPRAGWVLVMSPEPGDPMVVARGALDVRPGPDIEELVSALRETALPPNVVSRSVERVSIGGDPALVCHDLIGHEGGAEGVRLEERGLAVRQLVQERLTMALDIRTFDLAAFEQIAASAAQTLAGARINAGSGS